MNSEATKIISLIDHLGKIEGRKKIQKIVHILQNEGVDFGKNFKYANYGPYSIDLQLDLGQLVKTEILNESAPDANNNNYTYSYNRDNKYFRLGNTDQEIISKSTLINYLNSLSPQELELVSTIYFLKNKDAEYKDDEIVKKKISYLKPHLESKIDQAFDTFYQIKKGQFNAKELVH